MVFVSIPNPSRTEHDAPIGHHGRIIIVERATGQTAQVGAVALHRIDVEQFLAGGRHGKENGFPIVGNAGRAQHPLASVVQQAEHSLRFGGHQAEKLMADRRG